MDEDDQRHAVYRWRGPDSELLYIGRTNDPFRRTEEHRATKSWVTQAVRIDLEWVPAEVVREVERRAIRSEHPRYNIQHNSGRIRVEVSAEISASGNGLAMILAGAAVVFLAGKWASDVLSTRMVQRRALRAGMTVELPPVRNPDHADPPSWALTLLYAAMAASYVPRQDGIAPSPEFAGYAAWIKAQQADAPGG